MTEISNPNPNPDNSDNHDIQIISQEFTFSGPFPPPQILASYEKTLPGSAAKIMDAAMRQSEHRMELESKFVAWDITNSRIGLIFGLAIGLAGFITAYLVARLGKETASSIIGGGTLVSLVGVFVYGSRNTQQKKQEDLPKE